MIKLFLLFFWLIIIPTIVGKILLSKEEKSYIYSWLLGNLLQMGVFFLISVPLVLKRAKFTTLLYLYGIIMAIIAVLVIIFSFIKNKNIKLIFKNAIVNIKDSIIDNITIFKVIAIILILIQLCIKFVYSNVNNDDANFVAISTTMIDTNQMYLHDINGNEMTSLESRKILAPISAYYSVISCLLDIHVTIVTHTIMPIVFISLAYAVYYYLGKRIFKEKDSNYIFLILLSVLNIYAFSIKGYNRYMLLYTWFGRAILAGIMLPFIWYISFDAMNKEKNTLLSWITLFVTVLASSLCSQMAVPLIITSIMVLAIINTIRDKKISYIFKSFVTIIPSIIIGIIYLIIK